MNTIVSSKGQVVLPCPIRRKLGIEAGDPLEARIEGNHIVLIPQAKTKRKPTIRISKVTGMPMLNLGSNALKITNEWVRDRLVNFS